MKTTFHSFEISKMEMRTPDKTKKLLKEEPEIHHNFSCKKTIFNDVDAELYFLHLPQILLKEFL